MAGEEAKQAEASRGAREGSVAYAGKYTRNFSHEYETNSVSNYNSTSNIFSISNNRDSLELTAPSPAAAAAAALAAGAIRPTRKRFLILALYSVCSMEKSFQWINLSTITNKVALYYQVDNMAVNWTSVLFMLTFIPLVLPTGWLIERIGLRKAILIGSGGISLGALIKCFSCQRDLFWLVIVGQVVVSLSEQFIFCVPARIASVWFPDHQVSLATGVGIFGNQCGIALGFLVPQALLGGRETPEDIGVGLDRLFWWTAVVSGVTLLALLVLFDDAPADAPGAARLRKIQEELEERQTRRSLAKELTLFGCLLRRLISDRNCALLVVAYGINVGSGYAIQTLMNQMVTGATDDPKTPDALDTDWPVDANQVVGAAGMVTIMAGMLGALFWGHLCDRTHRYMAINKVLYLGSILGMILFGLCLRIHNHWLLYAASAYLGFNLIGYTVVGLDTVVEMTYPAPELVSTSVMNLSPQIFGTAITFASSAIVDTYSSDACTLFLVANLLVGLLVTWAIREHLRRQEAIEITQEARDKSQLERV